MLCNDFIFSEERPLGPRLPRARFGTERCAGGTHPDAAVVTTVCSGKPKERAGGRRGDRGCQNLAGALLRGDHGSQSTVLLRTPTLHP